MEKKKILLVDDEADFLEVIGMRIKGWGYDLIKAAGGQEAVDAVISKKPDIIILDYLMPGMNGVEALREIRKINPKIPVIMLTAYPEETSVKGAQDLGISAFIPKLSAYADIPSALKEAVHLAEKQLEKKE